MKRALAVLGLLALSTLALGQTSYNPPTVYAGSGLHILVTGGTVNLGGKPVTVAAVGATAVSANKTDCSAPSYPSCAIVYSDSSGTVALTTAIATAATPTNTILAYVTTGASTITSIVAAWQNGQVFSNIGTATGATSGALMEACGTTTTCGKTTQLNPIVVSGTVPLSSGTPSTATLTALPFTSNTSYVCTASPEGGTAAIAAGGVAITKSSGSQVVFTGPNTVTTVIDYICIGS